MTIALLLFLIFLLVVLAVCAVIGVHTDNGAGDGLGIGLGIGTIICIFLFVAFTWGLVAGRQEAEGRVLIIAPSVPTPHPPAAEGGSR